MSLNFITKLLVLLLLPLMFTAVSCNKPTEPTTGNVTITVEDASCTEVWLKITAGSNALIQDYILYENDNKKLDITLKQRDTVITIENLLPKHDYRYKAMNPNNVSNEVLAITLDTTSHNFAWQVFDLGTRSSLLRDAYIIDANNIWVVGGIQTPESYTYDSLGNIIPIYNYANWNGEVWELKRVFFQTICGNSSLTAYEAGIIHFFEDREIWITSAGDKFAVLVDGKQTDNFCLPTFLSMSIKGLWGKTKQNLYVLGSLGKIAHYDGKEWVKLSTNSTVNFLDMVCFDEKYMYSIGTNYQPPYDVTLLKITGNSSQKIKINGLPAEKQIRTLWAATENKFYFGGARLYEGELTKSGMTLNEITPTFLEWYIRSISGNGHNDIFVAGDHGEITHFNGRSWRKFSETEIPPFQGSWYKIVVKGDVVCAVGNEGGLFGKVLIGRRIN